MIKVELWNNNADVNKLLKDSFKKSTNMIKNQTLVISLILNGNLAAVICLISNENLIKFLSRDLPFEEINSRYSIRASEGGYIYNMAVRKDFRQKGLSKKLLNIALYTSNLLGYQYCHAHCENKISEIVFKKKGFIEEKVFKNKKNKDIKLVTIWI